MKAGPFSLGSLASGLTTSQSRVRVSRETLPDDFIGVLWESFVNLFGSVVRQLITFSHLGLRVLDHQFDALNRRLASGRAEGGGHPVGVSREAPQVLELLFLVECVEWNSGHNLKV